MNIRINRGNSINRDGANTFSPTYSTQICRSCLNAIYDGIWPTSNAVSVWKYPLKRTAIFLSIVLKVFHPMINIIFIITFQAGRVEYTKTTDVKIDNMMDRIDDVRNRLYLLSDETLDANTLHREAIRQVQDKLDKMCRGKVVWTLELSEINKNVMGFYC